MSVKVTLNVDTNGLHNDKTHPLNHLSFSDDRGDTNDRPGDPTSFDTFLNSGDVVTWEAIKTDGVISQLTIVDIQIDSASIGFFISTPALQRDGTWQATVGTNNSTSTNMECEYTIVFNDGIVGDSNVPIDPKLQIRKKPQA